MKNLTDCIGEGAERFVASLLALVPLGSYNTGYTARFTHPNPSLTLRTSFMLGTLGEISAEEVDENA